MTLLSESSTAEFTVEGDLTSSTGDWGHVELGLPRVGAGALRITAADPLEIVQAAVKKAAAGLDRPLSMLAAHITSLNAAHDPKVRTAFEQASAAYADGISVAVAAAANGVKIRKVATTDLCPVLIQQLSRATGQEVRVAIIGGESGLAQGAGRGLEGLAPCRVIHTEHGYHADWRLVLDRVRRAQPDVLILGLGMPLEAVWLERHHSALPPSILVTCGGWLRLLAAKENRAPIWMQRWQLEWLFRIATDPKRTAVRYGTGALTVLMAVAKAWRFRISIRSSRG